MENGTTQLLDAFIRIYKNPLYPFELSFAFNPTHSTIHDAFALYPIPGFAIYINHTLFSALHPPNLGPSAIFLNPYGIHGGTKP